MYDIIIIGAGPAGLTSAIYAARGGKSVLVLEANMAGGQIVNTPMIENYPGIFEIKGFEYTMNLVKQATDKGAVIKYETVTKIDVSDSEKIVYTNAGEYKSNSIIVATGLKRRKLEIEGEEEYSGKGVSYCATCDGAFYRNKDVAVIGGGNTALEDALFLSEYCNKVYIIHRRDTFRGEKEYADRIKNKDNISLVLNSEPVKITGEDTVTAIEVNNKETDESVILEVSGVFIAVGQIPSNGIFDKVLDLDEQGYINAGEDCYTDKAGVFVAGDCRKKKIRQLATAVGDGAVAALAAMEYLL